MGVAYFGLLLVLVGLGGSWYSGEAFAEAAEPMVPALFVFGDSLVDVGNNNYLKLSVFKADFAFNGIDFPGRNATGRFSNGLNAADILAERLGLETPPPYFSLGDEDNNASIMAGVNFASAGAGILDPELPQIIKQNVPFHQQIDYYSNVKAQIVEKLGSIEAAQKHLSRSLFAVVMGSNDILGYFRSAAHRTPKYTPQEHTDLMLGTLKGHVQRLYDLGARKMVVFGLTPLGCCPARRLSNVTGGCEEASNYWSLKYNEGLTSLLQNLKTEWKDFSYSFFNSYLLLQDAFDKPSGYGFVEVKSACCGMGKFNAVLPCTPISEYCNNRREHLFWDFYHPTEAASRILVDTAFEGSTRYAYPLNIKQLIAV